jgi:hypothetical protein
MVRDMFQGHRNPFHRTPAAPHGAADQRRPPVDGQSPEDRHPAMRGLDVSPVHGRHCICNRCSQHRAA